MSKNIIRLFRTGLVCAVLVILYLTTTPVEYSMAQNVNDKLSHLMAFFGLSLLADFSFPKDTFSWKKIGPLIAYGILIECIQYFLPYRSFSFLDMLGDAAGVALYAWSLPLLIQLPVLRKRGHDNKI